MSDSNKSVTKATAWYLICDVFLKGIAFFTMPIFTRLMSVGEMGKFSSYASWISILSIVVTLNLVPSVFLAKYEYEKEYDEYVSSVTILGMLSAFLFFVCLLPFKRELSMLLGMDEYALIVMCIYLIFCQIPGILIAKYRANLDYKKSVIISLSTTLITTLISILCTIWFYDQLKGRIYGFYISQIFLNFLIFVILIYKKGSFQKKYCRFALLISLPLVIHNLAGNIMHSSDRIMIERMDSDEAAGLYGVAYSCAMVANILRNSMNSAWEPWVFEKLNSNETQNIKKASYLYLIFFSVICVGIIAIAPELLLIMGGKPYLVAKKVVPPVVTAYMFSMVYSLYSGIELYHRKQKFFAVVAVICALANVILNLLFIPIYGSIAAAYTTLFCMVLECLLHYINVKKMGLHKIYNTAFNFVLVLIVTIISFAAVKLYDYDILRYSIIGIGGIAAIIVCVINRNKIMSFVKAYRKE